MDLAKPNLKAIDINTHNTITNERVWYYGGSVELVKTWYSN